MQDRADGGVYLRIHQHQRLALVDRLKGDSRAVIHCPCHVD